jgi:hypothetical protein
MSISGRMPVAVLITASILFCASSIDSTSFWWGYLADRHSALSCQSASNHPELVWNYTQQNRFLKLMKTNGYMLYSNGKWYNLDEHGGQLAKEVIKRSARQQSFFVVVRGKLTAETILVDTLTEVMDGPPPPGFKKDIVE